MKVLNAIKYFDLSDNHLPLPKVRLQLLMLIYLMISLPMTVVFPIWLPMIVFSIVLIKYFCLYKDIKLPKILMYLAVIFLLVLILLNIRSFGREYAFIAFLYAFSAMKILESEKQRDAFLLMLINMLLIMAALTASTNFFLFIYLLIFFFLNVYLQIDISKGDALQLSNQRENIMLISKIILMSLPFVFALFFFFPRIEPLWGVPRSSASEAGNELGDEMTPSSLSLLSTYNDLAFRVKFDSGIPSQNELYWRGPVLSNYDGKTWRRLPTREGSSKRLKEQEIDFVSSSLRRYRITYMGNTREWLVPLDSPTKIPNGLWLNSELQARSPRRITTVASHRFESAFIQKWTGLTEEESRIYTNLPKDLYPRTRELAQQLYQESGQNTAVFVKSVLDYFRRQGFYYDLTPFEGNEDIDLFMFQNKSGYCQHFASSFAFIMREAGIPARIVTGYQGGELNSISGELEVRQNNAHAWTEVYYPDIGWRRVDPTGAVAPSRLFSSNIMEILGNENLSYQAQLKNNSELVRFLIDAANASSALWQNWIINYNTERQSNLFEDMGIAAVAKWLWLVVLIILSVTAYILFRIFYRQKIKQDALSESLEQFNKALQKLGIFRSAHQPMSEVLKSNETRLSHFYSEALQINHLYYDLRFGQVSTSNAKKMEVLAQKIMNFNKKVNKIKKAS